MEEIKKQLGAITRNVRLRNRLSQNDLAEKLYLSSGKQIISRYECGERVMRLPEFIEFIKNFNETVVIDKDGICLIDEKNISFKNSEEKNNMQKSEQNLILLEKKGQISFYEDTVSKKQYQYVEHLGLLPVIDGNVEYHTMQTVGDISVKYNLNGCYGYSIWVNDRCYEDRIWSLEEVNEIVRDMFAASQKEKSISVMIMNIENRLEDEEKDLSCLDFSNVEAFIQSFDDAFLDGGEFRCECVMDIATPYALLFGELDSSDFHDAVWECAYSVYEKLKRESQKTVVCKYSDYTNNEIKLDYAKNSDNSYTITLEKDNKKLIFKEFYVGYSLPNLDIVMSNVASDYKLLKESPNLESYILNTCEHEDAKDEYNSLVLDVESMVQFFGENYLNNLIAD